MDPKHTQADRVCLTLVTVKQLWKPHDPSSVSLRWDRANDRITSGDKRSN